MTLKPKRDAYSKESERKRNKDVRGEGVAEHKEA
jgi:hypothetical protein